MRRLLVAAAAAVLAAPLLAVPAGAGGLSPALCREGGPDKRAHVPTNFTLEACFDGSTLVLANTYDAVLRVRLEGDTGTIKRSPVTGPGTAAAALLLPQTDTTTLPPGYRLAVPVGSDRVAVSVSPDLWAERRYELNKLLLGYLPGVASTFDRAAGSLAVLENVSKLLTAFDTALLARGTCEKQATNAVSRGVCSLSMSSALARAVAEFLVENSVDAALDQVDTRDRWGQLLNLTISTFWYRYGSVATSADLDAIAASNTQMTVDAVPSVQSAANCPPRPPQLDPSKYNSSGTRVELTHYACGEGLAIEGLLLHFGEGPAEPGVAIFKYAGGSTYKMLDVSEGGCVLVPDGVEDPGCGGARVHGRDLAVLTRLAHQAGLQVDGYSVTVP